MTTGSVDVSRPSVGRELASSLRLVAATKVPLLLALWIYEWCMARPEFIQGPVAFNALARWEARTAFFAATHSPDVANPIDGSPLAAQYPLPLAVLKATFWLADVLHAQRSVAAVMVTLLLLVPAIACARAAMHSSCTPRGLTVMSVLLLVGPGMWFSSSMGDHVLILLALAAALYGIVAERPVVATVATLGAALTHPAGMLLVASSLAKAWTDRSRRGFFLGLALLPLAALAAYTFTLSIAGYPSEVALAVVRRAFAFPTGTATRLVEAFGPADVGPMRAMDLHALTTAALVAIGALLSLRMFPAPIAIVSVGALCFLVRDWTDALSVAAWCFPAAAGWSRLLRPLPLAQWLPAPIALGMVPVLFRVTPIIWDWIDFHDGRPLIAGARAYAVERNAAMGRPNEPARPLPGGGSFQRFDFGVTYCTPAYGCRALDGLAAKRFEEAGGIAACGLPTRDPRLDDRGVWVYRFERGRAFVKHGESSQAQCEGGRSFGVP